MKIKIACEIESEAAIKCGLVDLLENEFEKYFSNKFYGEGVLNIIIGFICIKTRPGYENWHKIRKPRFKSHSVVKLVTIEGSYAETKNLFVWDVKLDYDVYDDFINLSDTESNQILAKEFWKSLSNLDALPRKVKDFNKEKFKEDMRLFFKEKYLIEF